MHGLIVVAHPHPESLTHAIVAQIADGIVSQGHTAEIADLVSEGFDPRFTQPDIAVLLNQGEPLPDVVEEQARIERADSLILVFPVYWWSFPALLKGWIDRVFTQGWAYEDDNEDGRLVKKLQHLDVHLVALGGADRQTYKRHGYATAMKTQIEHGIFDYCGAKVVTSELLLPSDDGFPQQHLTTGRAIGQSIFQE